MKGGAKLSKIKDMNLSEQELRDQISANLNEQRKISNILETLPKGFVFIRQIGKQKYVYRRYKENGKVVSIYIGNFDDEKTKQEITLIEEYSKTRDRLKALIVEEEELKEALNSCDNESIKKIGSISIFDI